MYSVRANNEVAGELLAGAEFNLSCFRIEMDKAASQEELRGFPFTVLSCCQVFEGRVEVGSVDQVPILLVLGLAMPDVQRSVYLSRAAALRKL